MAVSWISGQAADDYELASRALLRRLSELSELMAAAEPGTDDFLTAYDESRQLREIYTEMRGTWRVPEAVRALASDEPQQLRSARIRTRRRRRRALPE